MLRKQLKRHNAIEGVGQFANHTCCDVHWNANLEVAAVDNHEETATEPMGILRAKQDIEIDTEILNDIGTQRRMLGTIYSNANVVHAQTIPDIPQTPWVQ